MYILRTDDRPHILENFELPYLGNGSSDPLHVRFYGGVFEVGGSNGAISGCTKSKMVAGALLENFGRPYLDSGSSDTSL